MVVACILLVAFVPMIFNMVEKSKRESFAKSTIEYIASVKRAYSVEDLECYNGNSYLVPSSFLGSGTFYVPITTSDSKEAPKNYAKENTIAYDEKIPTSDSNQTIYDIAKENANNIVGKNGKSPFGKDIYGYIKIVREGSVTNYYIKVVDSSGNGNPEEKDELKSNLVESI